MRDRVAAVLPKMALILVLGLAACKPAPRLPADAYAALELAAEQPDSLGELRYEGRVFPRGSDGPLLFRYERRVLDLGESLCASHLTFDPSGEPVVWHQARHSVSHELMVFDEIHTQTGLVGQVVVSGDGSASFETWLDGRRQENWEAPGEPLVVGPTLFGYVQTNWASLLAGEVHTIRFVVLEDRRSYRFELQRVAGEAGTMAFEMNAASALLARGVPSMTLVFDADRNILEYTGLVPPLEEVGDGLESLDATVLYTHVSEVD